MTKTERKHFIQDEILHYAQIITMAIEDNCLLDDKEKNLQFIEAWKQLDRIKKLFSINR